jgi:hypothetical protein
MQADFGTRNDVVDIAHLTRDNVPSQSVTGLALVQVSSRLRLVECFANAETLQMRALDLGALFGHRFLENTLEKRGFLEFKLASV